jgi:hypothetical protein
MQIPDAGGLLSTEVLSADGQALGRVGTVYVPEGSVQPLLVSFPADSETPFVAPLLGAELLPEGLVLAYPAGHVTAGPTVDVEAALSVGEIGAVLSYYGRSTITRSRLTDRVTGTGDVGSVHPDVRAIPSFPTLGDDDLPPIVVTKPGATGLPS